MTQQVEICLKIAEDGLKVLNISLSLFWLQVLMFWEIILFIMSADYFPQPRYVMRVSVFETYETFAAKKLSFEWWEFAGTSYSESKVIWPTNVKHSKISSRGKYCSAAHLNGCDVGFHGQTLQFKNHLTYMYHNKQQRKGVLHNSFQ